jgi:hypothetical protein
MAEASGDGRKERRETVEQRGFAAVIGSVLDVMKNAQSRLPPGARANAGGKDQRRR